MHCIATNVHRFFQTLSLPLFIIHLKIWGTQLINLIFPLNQNINCHVIPAYSFYFYAVFLGYFYLFIYFWPHHMALQNLSSLTRNSDSCRAPPGKSHLGYYFLLLILFSLLKYSSNFFLISIKWDMYCDYFICSEYSFFQASQMANWRTHTQYYLCREYGIKHCWD